MEMNGKIAIEKEQSGNLLGKSPSKIDSKKSSKTGLTTEATTLRRPNLALYSTLYGGCLLLFCIQLVAILQNHSHLGGLTMFDTILLLIAKAQPTMPPISWLCSTSPSQSSQMMRPLLLVIGGIVFHALLFVNFTHALEAISCADSSSHFSGQFIAMVGLTLLAKSGLLVSFSALSIPHIPLPWRLLLHFGPPTITLALFVVNRHFTPADDFLISHLDRYLGAGLCLLLAAAIIPIFRTNLPYLLCDVPVGLDADQMKMDIHIKFPQVHCLHLHIYQQWPSSNGRKTAKLKEGEFFNIFAHIQVKLERKEDEGRQTELCAILRGLQEMLRQKGANKIDIEPMLVEGKGEKPMMICVASECQLGEKSCCDGKDLAKKNSR